MECDGGLTEVVLSDQSLHVFDANVQLVENPLVSQGQCGVVEVSRLVFEALWELEGSEAERLPDLVAEESPVDNLLNVEIDESVYYNIE